MFCFFHPFSLNLRPHTFSQLRELKKSLRAAERECENLKPEIKKRPKSQPKQDKEKQEKQTFDESDDDSASVKSDQTGITSSSRIAESVEEEEEAELFVDPSRRLTILNDHFLKEFTDFVASFVKLFIKSDDVTKLTEEV